MPEYIEKGKVINVLTAAGVADSDKRRRTWARAICKVDGIPAADVAPVVHGRWDKCGATRHKNHCTRCGSERPYRKIGRGYYLVWDSPYCPHCGAEMDGGEKDAEVQA